MPFINQTSVTTLKEMQKRKTILTSGCFLENFFRRGKFLEMSFAGRLQLQKAVKRNNTDFVKDVFDHYMNGTKLKEHRIPSGWQDSTRSIFMLGFCRKYFFTEIILIFWVEIPDISKDKSKIMTCLPLKTGTTNWQKTLASIMVHEKTGRLLDPLAINDVFDDVPRYYTNFNQTYLNPSMKIDW